MKRYRYGIMGKQFDILPTLTIRWFIGYEGKRKFDICFSWLRFFIQTNNFGIDAREKWKTVQKAIEIATQSQF